MSEPKDYLDVLAHRVAVKASEWYLASCGVGDLDDAESELSQAVNDFQFERTRRAVEPPSCGVCLDSRLRVHSYGPGDDVAFVDEPCPACQTEEV